MPAIIADAFLPCLHVLTGDVNCFKVAQDQEKTRSSSPNHMPYRASEADRAAIHGIESYLRRGPLECVEAEGQGVASGRRLSPACFPIFSR